jgi:predicted nucleic acid-binding protein
MIKAYFDNCIESGRVRADLQPPEMAAVRSLLKARNEGKVEIVTSRESWREQDRAKDPRLRAQLAQSRGDTPVVSNDHKLFGFHNQMDRLGTVAVTPLITEIIDEELFRNLTAAGLNDADARHLMYATRNECDRFVSTDPHFTSKRQQLEALCQCLKILTPSELAAELLLNTHELVENPTMPSPPSTA